MIARILWWLLVLGCALVVGLQLQAAAADLPSRNYEYLAFIALVGLWAMALALPCAVLSAWRWRSLAPWGRLIGAGLPVTVFLLAALAAVLAA